MPCSGAGASLASSLRAIRRRMAALEVSDCIIREELGRVGQAFCAAFSAYSHLCIWPIWRTGTPTQKEAYFVHEISGEKVACFGLSKADGGSNVRAMKTSAEKVDVGYRINGSKLYITNAPMVGPH